MEIIGNTHTHTHTAGRQRYLLLYFIQLIIVLVYNIILYNIQNRKTEKVEEEAKTFVENG